MTRFHFLLIKYKRSSFLSSLKVVVFCLLWAYSAQSLAWSTGAMQVIGKVVSDNLTTVTKRKIRERIAHLDSSLYQVDNDLANFGLWGSQFSGWCSINTSFFSKFGLMRCQNWHSSPKPLYYSQVTDAPLMTQKKDLLWILQKSLQVLQADVDDDVEKGIAILLLWHFASLAHQPNHAIALYSPDFPQGDAGGVLFQLAGKPTMPNLQEYWEQMAGDLPRCEVLSTEKAEELSKKIQARYPPEFFQKQLKIDAPDKWLSESHKIARNFMYTIKPGETPDQNYYERTVKISKQRMVLAGYRIADILNKTFDSTFASKG